jgi:hypothetical protein
VDIGLLRGGVFEVVVEEEEEEEAPYPLLDATGAA